MKANGRGLGLGVLWPLDCWKRKSSGTGSLLTLVRVGPAVIRQQPFGIFSSLTEVYGQVDNLF